MQAQKPNKLPTAYITMHLHTEGRKNHTAALSQDPATHPTITVIIIATINIINTVTIIPFVSQKCPPIQCVHYALAHTPMIFPNATQTACGMAPPSDVQNQKEAESSILVVNPYTLTGRDTEDVATITTHNITNAQDASISKLTDVTDTKLKFKILAINPPT
ncbi:hypothetical protein SERLADRAFT_440632 [Serpula lacrymans var. lacrymans S7.9]|uniref:Uncharacterized protein n=1 Tax=Serpula lacrymans var. lacrymans (strain S7.9) TaxID=578457 RepID=F8P384_SERL9|nr:uncharacterized protein SERLADRAFT_440632 [Serpula lacrymans var. lacrymans S7.9]EGO22615.1 hypothetical protein SERLADRAFT_440632 [Serpula lacrymans var. lacrymans S7.9]